MNNTLTVQEMKVAYLVSQGHRTKDIARILCVTPHTVNGYLQKIYNKLELNQGGSPKVKLALWYMKRNGGKDECRDSTVYNDSS